MIPVSRFLFFFQLFTESCLSEGARCPQFYSLNDPAVCRGQQRRPVSKLRSCIISRRARARSHTRRARAISISVLGRPRLNEFCGSL